MTPQEKAEELVSKYLLATPIGFHIEDAKKCAIIAVDELLEECRLERDWYWVRVKTEIENL
jgi:hypothetical protein